MKTPSNVESLNQASSFVPFRELRTNDSDELVGEAIAGTCSSVDEAIAPDFAAVGESLHQQHDPRSAVLVSIQEDEPLDDKNLMRDTNVVEWRSWALQVNTLLNDFHNKLTLMECRVDFLMGDMELRKDINNKTGQFQDLLGVAGKPENASKAHQEHFDPVGKDWVPLNVGNSSSIVRPAEQDVAANASKTSCRFTAFQVERGNSSQREIGIGDHLEAPTSADAVHEATSEENRRWGKPGFLRSRNVDDIPLVEPSATLRWAGSTTRAAHLLQAGANPVELESASRRGGESPGLQRDRLSPAHALRRLNNFLENVGVSKHQALKESRLLGSPASDASQII